MASKRTIRTVKVVIETQGISDSEHDRRVGWVEKNILGSNQDMVEAFVSVVIYDEQGNMVRYAGNGRTPSPETKELIDELVEGNV